MRSMVEGACERSTKECIRKRFCAAWKPAVSAPSGSLCSPRPPRSGGGTAPPARRNVDYCAKLPRCGGGLAAPRYLQSEQSRCIFAEDRASRRIVDAVRPLDKPDRVGFAHIGGVIGAHQ